MANTFKLPPELEGKPFHKKEQSCNKCKVVFPYTLEHFSLNTSTNTNSRVIYLRPDCRDCNKKMTRGKNKAKKLVGNSLRDFCGDDIKNHGFKGKGNFGQLIEKYYFQYEPNSTSEADFSEVGMELKTTPLKRISNGSYRSKERLVLNIINYFEVVNQRFETSSFYKKNSHLLLIFYF